MRHNNIRGAGQQLAECARILPQLLVLDIMYNDVNFKHMQTIENAVKENVRRFKVAEPERLRERVESLRVSLIVLRDASCLTTCGVFFPPTVVGCGSVASGAPRFGSRGWHHQGILQELCVACVCLYMFCSSYSLSCSLNEVLFSFLCSTGGSAK